MVAMLRAWHEQEREERALARLEPLDTRPWPRVGTSGLLELPGGAVVLGARHLELCRGVVRGAGLARGVFLRRAGQPLPLALLPVDPPE
ncbi:hypothetical protein ACN28S_23840 [Cystobacter fuscus]